ncbi:hypothetical protein ANCDUO_05968 [Ancylostoma duodenale]|uniref:Uncharacterized protein n=1 Tax=Ancylostoma duodenale TaxID=51022 RepID=A0A0C2H2P3_9BILA|nr:hypothetical protein ANCDUO_05968 [Ancylostoma duodenale]
MGDLMDVFGEQIINMGNLSEKADLVPRNLDVNRINGEALDKLPGQLRVYRSIDEVLNDQQCEYEYSGEFLNSLAPAGVPPHALRLKKKRL